MIRQSVFLLLFTLLFTACVERNQTLTPTINASMAKPIAPLVLHHTTKINHDKKTPKIQNNTVRKNTTLVTSKTGKVSQENKSTDIASTKVNETSYEDEPFFTLNKETKNKISGFFVIIIGIIILL